MKKFPSTDTVLFSLILITGGILRFYNYHQLPFSYDEFSALFRTRMDSFRDLIHYGVVTTDTHPAGIQVFMYYWVRVFGEGAPLVKLPFMVAGIGAIFLTYKISAAWFNTSVALVAAMMVSFLQYPITFSQYARPYVSGLFFVLLFVWSFHNAFVNRSKNWKYHRVMYVLAGAACAYNHHFSLFFLGLAGSTGLFLIPRNRIIQMMVANLLIFVLYVPHLGIFFTQLGKGGVESWLRKPEPEFFLDYLSYLMHHSLLMYLAAAALFGGSLFFIRNTIRSGNGYRIVMMLWIAVTWVTAFYYSIFKSSVLQHSVLIFTFPFLVILVFSFMGELAPMVKVALLGVVGCLSILTLVFSRQHYVVQYRSVLEQTFSETASARKKYGEKKVACATNISEKVQHYYSAKYHFDPNAIIPFDSTISFIEFREALKASPADYLAIGWVNIADLEFFSVAREVFPELVEKRSYYTGDFYLLAKSRDKRDTVLANDLVFVSRADSLNIYRNTVTRGYPMLFDHGRLRMPGWLAYSVFYSGPLGHVVQSPENYLLLSLEVENPRPGFESQLICEITRDEKVVYWTARSFSEFTRSDWGRYKIHLSVKLIDLGFNYAEDNIRVYLSNIDEEYYYLNYFKIETTQGNPLLYSLFQKIGK